MAPDKALLNIYFKLAAEPQSEWEQFFEIERHNPMHTLWRTATLKGKYIVLECPLDEIDFHYADLENSVAASNAGYRKHLGLTERTETSEGEKAKDDKSPVADIQRQLGFGR